MYPVPLLAQNTMLPNFTGDILKDIATRDMLLNMTSVTPQANITFGDVRETADVNKIMDVIEDMVENAFATSLVNAD